MLKGEGDKVGLKGSSHSFSSICVLGGGNLGQALVRGWIECGGIDPKNITVTRRDCSKLKQLGSMGVTITEDNVSAVKNSDIVIIAVQPQQIPTLFSEIREVAESRPHTFISVVSGTSIESVKKGLGLDKNPVVRAMPNTAVSVGEAVTCLAAQDSEALGEAEGLFNLIGQTLNLPEEMITPSTALSACGIAFFLRCIRAASQGGIEIGFHPEEALFLAAQTAKGAASLILDAGFHPEDGIDKVTTPRGCTIAGLNEMEHHGLSSAIIRGIVTSAEQAEGLKGE
jgi:pyrroline-5-carboxylate reductase